MNSILLKYRVPLLGPDGPGSGDGGGSGSGSSAGTGSGSSSGAPASPSPSAAPAPSGPSATPATPAAPAATPSPSPGSAASPSHQDGGGAPGGGESGAPPELDFESIFSPPLEAPAPAATPAVPAAPAATPPAQPAAPAQAAAPAAVPSPQATQPQPASQPATQQLDPADPMALAHALSQNESAAIDHIASTMFQLSKEEVEALENDTVGTIPKLLAKSFVKAQGMMLQQLGRIVPQMMSRQVEALRRNAGNEQKFFQRWQELKGHGDLVRRLAATYRSMNPNATLDTMIEELGPIAMMTAKIPLSAGTAQPGVPAAPPTATPAAGNGVRPPQPSPFVPAVGGPGAAPSTTEVSPWEAMFSGEE